MPKTTVLLCACLAVAGCNPSTQSIDAGPVSLKFGGLAESGYQFDLANGSSNPIGFHGRTKLFSNPSPALSEYAISCQFASHADMGGYAIEHGQKPALLEVPPRKKMRLFIADNGTIKPWGGQKRCKVYLRLDDGSTLESDEFTP